MCEAPTEQRSRSPNKADRRENSGSGSTGQGRKGMFALATLGSKRGSRPPSCKAQSAKICGCDAWASSFRAYYVGYPDQPGDEEYVECAGVFSLCGKVVMMEELSSKSGGLLPWRRPQKSSTDFEWQLKDIDEMRCTDVFLHGVLNVRHADHLLELVGKCYHKASGQHRSVHVGIIGLDSARTWENRIKASGSSDSINDEPRFTIFIDALPASPIFWGDLGR